MNYWDTSEYTERMANEWWSCGQIDPAKYESRDAWVDDLTWERKVKKYIYDARQSDADDNKYMCPRHGIMKYDHREKRYTPLDWDCLQEEAFDKFGRRSPKYKYSPFNTDNIDDYYFDFVTADRWVSFLEAFIFHVEGSFGNQLILLSLEQRAFFRFIFGWKYKETGLRRYSEIFKYIPRKNSKSFDLAALALGTMIMDGEEGCKIVAVATTLPQARAAWKPARQILLKDEKLRICNGELAKQFKVYKDSITANDDNDVFQPIAFSDDSNHGGNFHLSILDELHVMKDDSMFNVCITSQGARDQAMIAMITTASTSGENFCNDKLKVAKDVCDIKSFDDNFLPVLYYSDPDEFGDDWHDEAVHARVNPMLGLGKKEKYLKSMHKKACTDPKFTNSFLRLELNWITASDVAAFNSVAFNQCTKRLNAREYKMIYNQEVPRFLLGEKCYVGLDLASKNDLCALTLDFPGSDYVISWSFTPKKNRKIKNIERFAGRINYCGDEIINFKDLRESFEAIMSNFEVMQLGFDPRFATELIQLIEENKGIECVDVGTSPKFLNEPTRSVIDDVQAEKVKHNGCILFAWQIGNCLIKEDAQELIMLQKSGSTSPRKIDAAAAWVNARALRLLNTDTSFGDAYERDGSFF